MKALIILNAPEIGVSWQIDHSEYNVWRSRYALCPRGRNDDIFPPVFCLLQDVANVECNVAFLSEMILCTREKPDNWAIARLDFFVEYAQAISAFSKIRCIVPSREDDQW